MPKLLLVATGGTIAGSAADTTDTSRYRAGALSTDSLLAALPEAASLGQITAEQPFALDSKDMTPIHWLALATLLRERLAAPEIDGIVVTHGTDTLEETGFFLHLTLPRTKPVVLTAAMRPATARSADGPMNLLQALACAGTRDAAAFGPLVVAGDRIWRARDCSKQHTHAPDALGGVDAGPIGVAIGTQVRLDHVGEGAATAFAGVLPNEVPRVDVLSAYAGAPADLIDASVANGAAGIVLALAGHGSVPADWLPAIGKAVTRGIPVVRASRVASGGVMPQANFDDAAHGTQACGRLTPWQARVALMLAISTGMARNALQETLLRA